MVDAIVLLNVLPGKEQIVKDTINDFSEVSSCRVTFGEYDLIVELNNVDKIKSLGSLITKKIRKIEGVTKTITLIISESIGNNNDPY
ncbi:MAG: Lrp/AsnC ligand binding domain-containing protein [Candidatus Hodarchaeales archaeon]